MLHHEGREDHEAGKKNFFKNYPNFVSSW